MIAPQTCVSVGEAIQYLLTREGDLLQRRKPGFGVPIGRWLRGPLQPLLENVLQCDRLSRVGLLPPDSVSRLVQAHVTGEQNHQRSLSTLLTFQM